MLARLLPDGYRDDPEAAGSSAGTPSRPAVRASVSRGPDGARHAARRGGRVRLGPEDSAGVAAALNDVRLAHRDGARHHRGLRGRDGGGQAGPTRRSAYLEVYHWLGYLQDSLVQALW